MSTKIEHGLGDEITVTTAPQLIEFTAPSGNSDWADQIEIWNTGSIDVRIQFNVDDGTGVVSENSFSVADAGIVPAEEKSTRFNLRNPIKRFVCATESGESTIKYFAS